MFRNIFNKVVRPLSSPFFITASALVLYSYLHQIIINKHSNNHRTVLSILKQKIQCLQTIRANKPQIVKILNQSKQQVLILIYNRQSQQNLRDQIMKYEEIVQKLGINKVVLVDQTDVRHLETFSRIIRQQIEQDQKQKNKQPVDLQNKIKILYINPNFDTNKPFFITSQQQLSVKIQQIRNILKLNPTQKQLKQSIQKFNCTTVIKNCFNNTCIEQYKQKIRQLIQLELFKDKQDNFMFYATNSKQQATKISSVLAQGSNKQEIYVFRNDILGMQRQLYSTFIDKQGNKYHNQNRFMMMIRPRVHIINRKSLSTDLYWYVSCLRINSVPTFSINNTTNNMPLKLINDPKNNQIIVWSKGHYKERQLLQRIKQKYGNNIQLLVLQTNIPSQFFRHVYLPQRYCIFKLSPQVPYPKMLIKPPVLNIDFNIWNKLKKIQYRDDNTIKNQAEDKNNNDYGIIESVQGDNQDYDDKWARVIEKINKFVQKPINYDNVRLLNEKQQQINAQQLKQMLNFKNQPTQFTSNRPETNIDKKWIFRICGVRNSCLYSAYQKYGIDINTPVYKLDAQVQNVAIDQGDYQVDGNSINLLT